MPKRKLAGQTAWISGATKGIGEGAALLFAREGAAVAVIGRDDNDGCRVVRAIKRKGGKAVFIRLRRNPGRGSPRLDRANRIRLWTASKFWSTTPVLLTSGCSMTAPRTNGTASWM